MRFQERHKETIANAYSPGDEWFTERKVKSFTAFLGWGFYLVLLTGVTALAVLAVLTTGLNGA
jgi:hypothetical protein